MLEMKEGNCNCIDILTLTHRPQQKNKFALGTLNYDNKSCDEFGLRSTEIKIDFSNSQFLYTHSLTQILIDYSFNLIKIALI